MANERLFNKETLASHEIAGRPTYLTMKGYADFATKLLISSVNAQANVNYQLNYAFSEDAYAYIFGDRMTISNISGIAMAATSCTDKDAKVDISPANFVKFYNTYKLGVATTPAELSFSTIVIKGYFISMNVALIYNREDAYQFQFQFLGRITT